VHAYKFFEDGIANEAIVIQWLVLTTLWGSNSEEGEGRNNIRPSGDFLVGTFVVLFLCYVLGVLQVTKHLKMNVALS